MGRSDSQDLGVSAALPILTLPQERLMKHLAAMGSVYETGPNEYVPTPFSKILKEPIYRDAYYASFVSFKVLASFSV